VRQSRWANAKTLLQGNLRYLRDDPAFLLSCDTKGMSLEMLLRGLQDYLHAHAHEQMIWFSMINHPKLMFAKERELLRCFVDEARRRYGVEFMTCSQALMHQSDHEKLVAAS